MLNIFIRSIIFIFLSITNTNVDAKDHRPNILLIVADDLGYTDLGSFGSEISTPVLDSLAYEGIRFTNFHTGRACQQTRAMLMSGRNSSSVIKINPSRSDGERAHNLKLNVVTLPELLSDLGYKTYMSGKWDLGISNESIPASRGFDKSFALLEASSSHFKEYFWSDNVFYQEDFDYVSLNDLPENFYSTFFYTDKMLEYLSSHDGDEPWFGYLSYTAPHWPLQVPDEFLNLYKDKYSEGYDILRDKRITRANYLGVIPSSLEMRDFMPTAKPWLDIPERLRNRYARAQEIYASMLYIMDQQIGRVVTYLKNSGDLDNTIIFFMSDNGASAVQIGIEEGPTSMPLIFDHFNDLVKTRINDYENLGRIGSFIDRGKGFGEAATAPFKYYKSSLSEGGIRSPAFIYFPKIFSKPEIENLFISVMDLLPTFLDVAGVKNLNSLGTYNGRIVQSLQGNSIWPFLIDNNITRSRYVVGWSKGGYGAIIKNGYKAINEPAPGLNISASISQWRLYDLNNDPLEEFDIAADYPDLLKLLEEEWKRDWL